MATFDLRAGTLNVTVHQGNDVSMLVDFSIDTTGYSWDADVFSTVTGQTIVSPAVSTIDAAVGQHNVDLTAAQVAALAVGTYGLRLEGTAPGGDVRKYLIGYMEVLP